MPRAALAPALRVRLARRGWTSGLALGGYVLLAFLYFGLPALFHSGRTYIGIPNGDSELEIWAFAWWPHAILHGHNPFFTHAIWAPSGVSLAWPTMAPGLVLAFAPLTLLLGPVASFDIAFVVMPALSAWTAFLLCRHVTRSFWPSLVGGYLFGFSAYELGQLQGHIQLASVFLVPLVALVVLRYVEGELTRRGVALRLGLLLGLELTFSTEITFTLTMLLLMALVLAYLLVPSARRRLRSLPLPLAGAGIVAALVASPLLYYMLTNFHANPFNPISPTQYSADLLNFVVPSNLVAADPGWADAIARHFTGSAQEQGSYYGAPALVILVWFAARRWRTAAVRFLLATVALVVFLSFGAWLHVEGHQVITLPWEHIAYLPLFDNVLTVRFSMYIALGLGVIVAIWAASRGVPVWARATLPALAVLALVPHLHRSTWATTTHEPAFIRDGIYRQCLRPDDNVLVFPAVFHGNSMLWQAEAGFRFRMASGYVSANPPKEFMHPPGVASIAVYGEVPDDQVAPIREYVRLKHVTVILVEQGPVTVYANAKRRWELESNPWPARVSRIAQPHEVGGVFFYRLDGTPPCAASSA